MIRVTPHRTVLQRFANRLGHRFGILPFPVRFEGDFEARGDRTGVFEEIYQGNFWGSDESLSGPGSGMVRTAEYREGLVDLLGRRKISSMFDAPCGDLNWMASVLDQVNIQYSGGDISEVAVTAARQRVPNVDVRIFDMCSDEFPEADLWHCRDALFHLSFADIWLALANAAKAEFKYVLLTTNRSRLLTNLDIDTGAMRYLDLERAPFFFPPALEYLKDYADGEYPRYMALWPASVVQDVIRKRR